MANCWLFIISRCKLLSVWMLQYFRPDWLTVCNWSTVIKSRSDSSYQQSLALTHAYNISFSLYFSSALVSITLSLTLFCQLPLFLSHCNLLHLICKILCPTLRIIGQQRLALSQTASGVLGTVNYTEGLWVYQLLRNHFRCYLKQFLIGDCSKTLSSSAIWWTFEGVPGRACLWVLWLLSNYFLAKGRRFCQNKA